MGHFTGSKIQEQMKDKDGNPTGTQLTITNADSSDAGDYTCTSANTHGEVTRSVQVTVITSSSKRSTVQENSKLLGVQSLRLIDAHFYRDLAQHLLNFAERVRYAISSETFSSTMAMVFQSQSCRELSSTFSFLVRIISVFVAVFIFVN